MMVVIGWQDARTVACPDMQQSETDVAAVTGVPAV